MTHMLVASGVQNDPARPRRNANMSHEKHEKDKQERSHRWTQIYTDEDKRSCMALLRAFRVQLARRSLHYMKHLSTYQVSLSRWNSRQTPRPRCGRMPAR